MRESYCWACITAWEHDVLPSLLLAVRRLEPLPPLPQTGDGGSEIRHHSIIAAEPRSIHTSDRVTRQAPISVGICPPSEFAHTLSDVRRSPDALSRYFLDPGYKRYDGSVAREELSLFLRSARGFDGDLIVSPALCRTAGDAAIALLSGPVRHSRDLEGAIKSAAPQPTCVGEMYWHRLVPPRSALQVIRDWLLDIGVPTRPHRLGVFDSDFSHVGTAIKARFGGACIIVAHVARIS